ncbi:class I adenylate-forming enzyme family protein [Actinomadura macrotermitis]|uniref:p-hydroxybenzoic acid--AMP ligase FadD22 n=1 Tax=Actinomadura macrotermitis TaxID=2585200 RepID=A0A7K0BZ47_9ACTN|nr:AMP-binding protein [Actinomadura macrotermitis]MQY06458.1 p-hydroxybenzoic acid--AMP ligase FadD22 [Actinomadura macrotermitis]
MTARNLAAGLAARSRRHGWDARPALYTGRGDHTHGQVHDLAARAATVLAARGAGPGWRVVIALPDGPGWFAAFLACARIGATAVPVNPRLPAADHRFMAEDCGARLAIADEEALDAFAGLDLLTEEELLAEAERAAPAAAVETGEPLYIHYTSGTTGTPKGVAHRHGDPADYHRAIGEGCLRIGPDDVTLSISKLYFTYGFCNAFVFPLFSGSSVVLGTERLTPDAAAEQVARHGVTRLYAVPSWYGRLAAQGDPAAFSSVRAAVSGGERFTLAQSERVAAALGAPVLDQLGTTELGCAATANRVDRNVPGTIGPAVPGHTVRVLDEWRRPVGPGVEGDLWVRGPTLMEGYLNRPGDTAEVLVDGGLLTGDRVVARPDGTFAYAGRADDMEMVGGIKVSPLEVEDLLATHRDVREVAVVATADAAGATGLRALVVPSPGAADDLPGRLVALARDRLAAFKVPRAVQLVDELPRTPSGKLRRHRLRAS